MCEAGRLLADFEAGQSEPPEVAEAVARCLTLTVDGNWVVWAQKIAMPAGHEFIPMTGGSPYPVDAVAECRRGGSHEAPQPGCTCGFHAVAVDPLGPGGRWEVIPRPGGAWRLDVALSGRVLAFEMAAGGVLFRAARQTVIRVTDLGLGPLRRRPPDDPEGRLAPAASGYPRGSGPLRLELPPVAMAAIVAVADDAGYCAAPARAASLVRPVRIPAGALTRV